ncbi:AI-2E family transporter [Rhizosaccharibacter radicis]|uniref:AI-2E family transporter n=1 Tax=Rhizosaccharibacter radicis TaxID=2782605 RepID=A0ABT1VVD4_9PROT|nr:AI-2E family transporter [Acetobacteraceae bacterium KSS12]
MSSSHLDVPMPEGAVPVPLSPPVIWSAARLAGVARTAIAVAIGGLLVWLLSKLVLLVFFAALLGITLRGGADWLAWRTGWKPVLVLTLLCVLILLTCAGGVAVLGPRLFHQATDLTSQLSQEAATLRDRYQSTFWGQKVMSHLQTGGGSGGGESATEIAQPAMKVLGVTLDLLATAVLLVITALYFAIAPDLYRRGMLRLVAIRHRPRAAVILCKVGRAMRRWLLGQMVDMLVVAVVTTVGLALLGTPVPLALGVLAGILTFIPYFGAILAAIPAVLVALAVSPVMALWVMLIYVLAHLVEGYLISPLVQKRLVELPPAVTILSMTAGGTLFGPLGIVLGTPMAAAGLVLVREFYVADILGDHEMRQDP